MSTENMKFEEAEINDIVEHIQDEFKVEHNTVKDFDEELWQTLEKIEIDLNWINVIESYKDEDYTSPNPEVVRRVTNENRAKVLEKEQAIKNDAPIADSAMFLRVEEAFKNNSSIEKIISQKIQLKSVLWELYSFSPSKRSETKKGKYLINWDLTFKLIALTYSKILDQKEQEESKKTQGNTDNLIDQINLSRLQEICIGLSTFLFLTPITTSNNFNNTLNTLIDYSNKYLGVNPFTGLFNVLTIGTLDNIETEDEELDYESRWTLTNILGITSGFIGKFLDRRKYRILLLAYIKDAYETEYFTSSTGAEEDFEKLIGVLFAQITPNYVNKDFVSKIFKMLDVKGENLNDAVDQITELNKNILDIDSVSLLLSSPILSPIVEEYGISDFLEDLFIEFVSKKDVNPRKEGVWGASEIFYFDLIVYRPVYFKSSKSIIAAISSMYEPENDHVSLVIYGAKSIAQEGFIKLSLTFLSYCLLDVIGSNKSGIRITMRHSIHKELFDYLNLYDIKSYVDESNYQILEFCASQNNVFGSLFCNVLNSFLNKFNFNNVIDFKIIQSSDESKQEDQTALIDISSFIDEASSDSKEAVQRIIKKTASINSIPATGIWARKLLDIQSDIHTVFNEVEDICVSNFRDLYLFSLKNIPSVNNRFWQNFAASIEPTKRLTLGIICIFFDKLQRIDDDRNYSSSNWSDLEKHINDKAVISTLQNISNAEQALISLEHIRKIRNLISHKSKSRVKLEWTQVNFLIQFYRFELKGYIDLVKLK